MALDKGGAPKNNTNAARAKMGRQALELALTHYGSNKKLEVASKIQTLVKMWQPIIDKAMIDGDLAAMREINDRLDGKPQQSVDLGPDTTVHFNLNYNED